jgi:alpha-glucosidase
MGYGTYDKKASSGDQVIAYAKYCLEYPVCEYRNAWRFQGQPVVERLHDKGHKWSELQNLVPDMIGGGLLGHPFMCPDMIGGGSWTAFLPGAPFDAELFVRSAQVHALCPMMQFSASPWRVLNKEHQKIIRDTVAVRQKFASKFVELARASGHTGEPMLRNLEYNYPGQGYAAVNDQFMMGTDLLVAPVVTKGQTERNVVIPPGTWVADDGETVVGPKTITVKTPLSRLPYFMLKK